MKPAKCCSPEVILSKELSLNSHNGLEKLVKTVVISGKASQTSQAVLLPMLANAEVVSHPVMAWKKGKTFAFSGPRLVAIK